mgnify:CR=1 FL=1
MSNHESGEKMKKVTASFALLLSCSCSRNNIDRSDCNEFPCPLSELIVMLSHASSVSFQGRLPIDWNINLPEDHEDRGLITPEYVMTDPESIRLFKEIIVCADFKPSPILQDACRYGAKFSSNIYGTFIIDN